jgi:hypothetical protein
MVVLIERRLDPCRAGRAVDIGKNRCGVVAAEMAMEWPLMTSVPPADDSPEMSLLPAIEAIA